MILKMSINQKEGDPEGFWLHTYQRGITDTYITAYLKTKYFREHCIRERKPISDLYFSSIKRNTNEGN